MTLIFLPPYSPELNPLEYIWDSIREDSFRNEVFNSIEGVENQLAQSLGDLPKILTWDAREKMRDSLN
ncbi:MAG: transposase [Syntrophobacteraceae bacterium]